MKQRPISDAFASVAAALAGHDGDRQAIISATHDVPHRYLGVHAAQVGDEVGEVVRICHPEATAVEVQIAGAKSTSRELELESLGDGLFAAWQPDANAELGSTTEPQSTAQLDHQVVFSFADGSRWQRQDPYRFGATLGDLDLYLLGEGTHQELWRALGARPMTLDGVIGFAFSVWAPNARRVSLVGDFCHWDGRLFPMQRLGTSGVFDLFMPGFASGEVYKFEILTAEGQRILKSDPMAGWAEKLPGTASRTFGSHFQWSDRAWQAQRAAEDIRRAPVSIYEVHLGSWLRKMSPPSAPRVDAEASSASSEAIGDTAVSAAASKVGDQVLSYRELAPRLVEHVKALGFNYLELLPVAEHPFDGSWGYQITGYFAPTARYGDPDDFRFFVDYCHQHGVGVILDWVPAHFVKDAHGLGRFDGSALYEHEDPRRGEHPDWGTYIFNYGRYEVRSFLLSNALFWLREFHVDGLRVDAVASMLYLDYSREEGEWVANEHGGRENLAAIDLLRRVNEAVRESCPGHFTVAEESTAWPRISHPVADGGLGFTFKWNMGWMHDTLNYFGVDPLFRSGSHDQFTFAMVYEHSERFINPLSHDEVVHGKGSLYGKMPGDAWQRLANLRALYAYQFTRPGKNLLFMGSELAPIREWNEKTSLDWYLLGDPSRQGFKTFLGELGQLYLEKRCLWESDPDSDGFEWVVCHDHQASVFAYERRSGRSEVEELTDAALETALEVAEGEAVDFAEARPRFAHRLLVVLNLTPVPRPNYRLGAVEAGSYRLLLSSDAERFGGSGYGAPDAGTSDSTPLDVKTEDVPVDGCRHSLVLDLPPLGVLLLEPR